MYDLKEKVQLAISNDRRYFDSVSKYTYKTPAFGGNKYLCVGVFSATVDAGCIVCGRRLCNGQVSVGPSVGPIGGGRGQWWGAPWRVWSTSL